MRWLTSALADTRASSQQRRIIPTAASSGQRYCHLATRLRMPSLMSSDPIGSDEGGGGGECFRVVWG
ncbi:MAG: hypothetical protein KGQ45_09050 [Burkholderiales bacterium]|nr:hypothetical protein [Burkholderiales bacterium]